MGDSHVVHENDELSGLMKLTKIAIDLQPSSVPTAYLRDAYPLVSAKESR